MKALLPAAVVSLMAAGWLMILLWIGMWMATDDVDGPQDGSGGSEPPEDDPFGLEDDD